MSEIMFRNRSNPDARLGFQNVLPNGVTVIIHTGYERLTAGIHIEHIPELVDFLLELLEEHEMSATEVAK